MYECDIKIPCNECDLAGNCSYECSMIALRTNLEAEYLNSMQEISIGCRLIANTEEPEHTCKFCYYLHFEPDAYPCSRCICNEPTENKWKPKEQEHGICNME